MTWEDWKYKRGETLFLFRPVGGRSTARAVVVYYGPAPGVHSGIYDRLDSETRRPA